MKSLVIKDMYNISCKSKSVFLLLAILALANLPTKNYGTYIIVSGVIFGMMVISSFSFDSISNWTRYAMVMPISRRELVLSKFAVHTICSAMGCLASLLITILFCTISGRLFSEVSLDELLVSTLASFSICFALGSGEIPLVLKYGTENARFLTIVSFLAPFAIFYGLYSLLRAVGVIFSERLVILLIILSPLIAVVWVFAMYKISCAIFEKQDL